MTTIASPDQGTTPRVLGKPASDPEALRGCQVMIAELVDVRRRVADAPLTAFVRVSTVNNFKVVFFLFFVGKSKVL